MGSRPFLTEDDIDKLLEIIKEYEKNKNKSRKSNLKIAPSYEDSEINEKKKYWTDVKKDYSKIDLSDTGMINELLTEYYSLRVDLERALDAMAKKNSTKGGKTKVDKQKPKELKKVKDERDRPNIKLCEAQEKQESEHKEWIKWSRKVSTSLIKADSANRIKRAMYEYIDFATDILKNLSIMAGLNESRLCIEHFDRIKYLLGEINKSVSKFHSDRNENPPCNGKEEMEVWYPILEKDERSVIEKYIRGGEVLTEEDSVRDAKFKADRDAIFEILIRFVQSFTDCKDPVAYYVAAKSVLPYIGKYNQILESCHGDRLSEETSELLAENSRKMMQNGLGDVYPKLLWEMTTKGNVNFNKGEFSYPALLYYGDDENKYDMVIQLGALGSD